MIVEPVTVITLEPGTDFVDTPYVRALTHRALQYIKAGFPVHFSGPTGAGKTTLALHTAAQLGRDTMLICGDDEFNSSDLVGGLNGYRRRYIKDNYIRSVLKTDESMTSHWVDNRLTNACQNGLTLVYDEFTRSRPEANNVLLSVLEERILPLPSARGGETYLKIHPDFNAIFTSNPLDYAGVHRSQDALRDRMVTIEMGHFDEETEVIITQAKSGLSLEDSRLIVDLVRTVRKTKSDKITPTVRACIMLGKVLSLKDEPVFSGNGMFRQACLDILIPDVPRAEREEVNQAINDFIAVHHN